MSNESDDLEAVRSISATLEPFEPKDRERILRWVRERIGMVATADDREQSAPLAAPAANEREPGIAPHRDIRSFVQAKAPSSGNHVAAVVAYFYRFIAPAAERKDGIGKDDLVEACRLAEIKRPAAPAQNLINAAGAGLLDRAERGLYRINSVGENLVAMVLPEASERSRPRKNTRSAQQKRTRKKATTTAHANKPRKKA